MFRMEGASIKLEFKTSPVMPTPQQTVYETQYRQYSAHQPPLEIPGNEAGAYFHTNVPYLYEVPPDQCQMCTMESGSCTTEYLRIIPYAQNNNGHVPLTTTSVPQPKPKYKRDTASDLSAGHMCNPGTSSSYQGGAGTSARGSKQPTEDALHRRQIRLMKNREAAKQCRRKKKEYIRCLENRVAVLENQNKSLMDELRAIKQMYRHQ